MSSPLPPLVTVEDPDWAKFKASDEGYLLEAASDTIRAWLGWHVSPSITETVTKVKTGSRGIVPLPSRYVTDVAEVVLNSDPPATLDPAMYEWFEGGWIQRIGQAFGGWGWGWPGGYFYGPDAPYYLPVYSYGIVDVTMTHGYDELPGDIQQVAFELAQGVIATGVGVTNVKEVQSPQYKTVFGATSGLTLNCDQKGRLANYRLGWFQ